MMPTLFPVISEFLTETFGAFTRTPVEQDLVVRFDISAPDDAIIRHPPVFLPLITTFFNTAFPDPAIESPCTTPLSSTFSIRREEFAPSWIERMGSIMASSPSKLILMS